MPVAKSKAEKEYDGAAKSRDNTKCVLGLKILGALALVAAVAFFGVTLVKTVADRVPSRSKVLAQGLAAAGVPCASVMAGLVLWNARRKREALKKTERAGARRALRRQARQQRRREVAARQRDGGAAHGDESSGASSSGSGGSPSAAVPQRGPTAPPPAGAAACGIGYPACPQPGGGGQQWWERWDLPPPPADAALQPQPNLPVEPAAAQACIPVYPPLCPPVCPPAAASSPTAAPLTFQSPLSAGDDPRYQCADQHEAAAPAVGGARWG